MQKPLLQRTVSRKPGRDIIRGLIGKNLITEKPDPEDKRATLLVLTAKGSKILNKSFELMAGSFTDFLGDLSGKRTTTADHAAGQTESIPGNKKQSGIAVLFIKGNPKSAV
jgi:hypothetical protein